MKKALLILLAAASANAADVVVRRIEREQRTEYRFNPANGRYIIVPSPAVEVWFIEDGRGAALTNFTPTGATRSTRSNAVANAAASRGVPAPNVRMQP